MIELVKYSRHFLEVKINNELTFNKLNLYLKTSKKEKNSPAHIEKVVTHFIAVNKDKIICA